MNGSRAELRTGTTLGHAWVAGEGTEPGLLLLHGTGGNERDLLGLGAEVAPGQALLGVRGRVMEHGMPRFFRRRAEGVFDLEDLRARTKEMATFLQEWGSAEGRGGSPWLALGYSNGANMAVSLLLRYPEWLAGAVLLRPMLPYAPETKPELAGKRVLVLAGQGDSIVPEDQVEALVNFLRRSGAEVRWEQAPGGHGLSRWDVVAAREFLGG